MSPSIFGIQAGGKFARRPAWLTALAILLCAAGLCFGQSSRPNIVVILIDDATSDGIGFNSARYGQPTQYETPNIDALAGRSVVARQGYAAAPLCSPSRAGLLTGQYQQRYGFAYNLDSMQTALAQAQGFRAEQLTIAQHLKGLGYSTGMVGKWHTGFVDGLNLPPDKGFDEFFGFWGGGRNYFAEWRPEYVMRRGDELYEDEYRAGGSHDPNDPNANDPVRGRYATDAFGDEAVDFINRRTAEADPYFLYVSLNAPHTPLEAKQADLDRFAHITDGTQKLLSAMTYAMDRAVGRVADAIEASGEETIVVFLNDNGSPFTDSNPPFRGNKGLTWEGGIRVPFFINAPGLEPGVYDAPISAYDVLPTLYAAAGGDVSQLNTDGVDLIPYLSGSNPEDPHEILVWRTHVIWALRKGDWKIGSPNGSPIVMYNLASDPGETTNVISQYPEIAEELYREMTYWESEMDKNRWGPHAGNSFDHFVFRGNSAWFSTADAWVNPITNQLAHLKPADGYPNLILEFQTKNSVGYGATSSMSRTTQGPMMINELRLTGDFAGSSNTSSGIVGNPLLFVASLSEEGPKIRLDATSSGTSARFGWEVRIDLQLFDDLEITGDGTQNFNLNGSIRDYDQPRSVTKTGTSLVHLKGHNTFRGDLTIAGGQVKLTGADAAIDGADTILIGSAGTLAMDSGLIAVERIDRSSGGAFQFTGGELRVVDIIGDLANQGGNFSPGASPALSSVSGNFEQTAGMLTMELGGTIPGIEYDQLEISGTASLGGTLHVELLGDFGPAGGESFELIHATGGISGTFETTLLPDLSPDLSWRLIYGPFGVQLLVDSDGTVNNPPGDYNRDGIVDAGDYVVWRKSLDSAGSLAADGNGDGRVDQDDYTVWRTNFGKTGPPAAGQAAGVPEPASILIAMLAMLTILSAGRRRTW